MVFLDVVYNHFGPVGNYLSRYAPQFFTSRHRTPWGDAINFDGEGSRVVRDFFIDNALYWLNEFHFDGLRLDAVHAICDDSTSHFLDELAATVRQRCGDRQVHLILENDDNASKFIARDADGGPRRYTAQWNDDIHHSLHTCLTGESDGYYVDYADAPLRHLGRCLTAGFAYQGEYSSLRGRARGSSTAGLPLTAFVSFLQNHDQIGNRAFGERLTALAEPAALAAAVAIVLLAPSPPLLFMGEEFGATTPFLYFCDFDPDLAAAVCAGRLKEFTRFARFSDAASAAAIPDPQAAATFAHSKLDWDSSARAEHASWLERYRELLRVRREVVIPMLAKIDPRRCGFAITGARSLAAHWSTDDGARLLLFANLGGAPDGGPALPPGTLVYTTGDTAPQALSLPWSTTWLLVADRTEATGDA
jgi:malto-oligosyltrehalose trehalohydrolase